MAVRGIFSPKKIILDKHSNFRDPKNRSRWAFKFGLLGGSRNWIGAFAFKDALERRAELVVAIHEQVTLTVQESPSWQSVRFRAICFIHGSLGLGCAPGEVSSPRGQFHDEQQIVRDQSTLRPDFDGREVDRGEDVPMRLDEGLPGGLSFSVRRRLDAVFP